MHPSARRLFDAIQLLEKIDGHSEPGKVATLLGVSPATITNWKARGVSKEGAEIADLRLGIRPAYVRHGEGDISPKLGKTPTPSQTHTHNVTSVDLRAKVPLISWVQAGEFQGVIDVYEPGQSDEWVDIHDLSVSENTFALRVTGDSMESPIPGARSFPEGTILIVDPNRSANAGDYVIAKDVQTQRATFKKLAHDAGRWYLKPLNPAYPTMEIDDPAVRIIGRVVEYQLRGKL